MKKFFTNKINLLFFLVLILPAMALVKRDKYQYKFQDPTLPIDKRVDDLISQMTLDEKVNQMINQAPAIERLGVPAFNWWNEALHGVARAQGFKTTVYPQAIAMAATFDKASLHTMADFTAEEGRAINNQSIKDKKTGTRYLNLTYWTPNINIFRDPRWGRGQETYGEDPFLTASMGSSFVTGLQGNDPKYLKAAACAKHYAVHSGPESTRHKFNTDVSDYDLWDTYLPAFKTLVVDAKVEGVMCAYNAFKGQPCCGSDLLLNNILRKQWNFTGYLTSDCGGIDDLYKSNAHQTFTDAASAAADAVLHGTDVECITGSLPNAAYKALTKAVADGKLTEKDLDVSLRRLFTTRFRLGLFDAADPANKFSQIPMSVLESPEHQAHALKMARQSIVLLKNQANLLPLTKNLKKIAIIGPNADNQRSIRGNYFGTASRSITPLEGIKAKLGPATEIVYHRGTDYVINGGAKIDNSRLVDSVKDADVIIYMGGITPDLEGEEMLTNKDGFRGGDRTSIMLPKNQTDLLKDLKATGKPVVFVLMTGSAVATPWESENIPAILNAWYGGQSAGTAIADVLFGDYNPGGRLPVTFYKNDKDLPTSISDYSMNNRTYRYFKGKPLYSFGYGLSYTNFAYDQLTVPATIQGNKPVTVSVKVTNTGKKDGEEVTQLYLSHLGLSVKTPIRALKGFERTFLKAGESKVIKFQLRPQDLASINYDGNQKVFKGKLSVSVGGSQPDAATAASKKTITKTVSLI
jgi:beta-glucosidase